MSIKKKSESTWLLDVRLRIKSKNYRKRESFTGGIKAAKAREHEIRKELQAEADKQNGSFKVRTFGEALRFFKERVELGNLLCLVNRLEKDLGNVELSDLAGRFDFYLQEIKKQYSVCTYNRYVAYSKWALNYAVKHEYLQSNPLQHFEKLKEIPRDRLLTEDEEQRLLKIVQEKASHLYAIVKYSMLVPCRKGEMVAMKREWYDMINNCIIIPAEYTKAKRPAIKPVPEEMVDYMRSIPIESDWIFYREEKGKYYPLGNFKTAWKRCLRLAGITNYRFHDSRRGSYTALILAGNLPHVVQKISGHSTDMSKVYLNISNMQAVKAVRFAPLESNVHDVVHSKTEN